MKVINLSYALLIVMCPVLFFACSKNDKPAPETGTNLLTTGHYWYGDTISGNLSDRDSIYYNAGNQIEKVISYPFYHEDTVTYVFSYNNDGALEKLISEGEIEGNSVDYYLRYDGNKRLDRLIAEGAMGITDTIFFAYDTHGHLTDISTVPDHPGYTKSHITYFRGDNNQIDSIQNDFTNDFAAAGSLRRVGIRLQTAAPGLTSLENINRSYLFLLATRLDLSLFVVNPFDNFYMHEFLSPADFTFRNGVRDDYYPNDPTDVNDDMDQPFSHEASSFSDGRLHIYQYNKSTRGVSEVKSTARLEYTIKK
jgi:hypothetical protein